MSGQRNGASSYITRPEFELFANDVRYSLNLLTTKIDNLSTKGTDFKSIWTGLGILLAILVAISSIFAWGLDDRIETTRRESAENRAIIERSDSRLRELEVQVAVNKKLVEMFGDQWELVFKK